MNPLVLKRVKHRTRALLVKGLKAAGMDDSVRDNVRKVEGKLKKAPDKKAQADAKACLAELERIAAGDAPIIVGPWLSEVGFEVLYWVPFLRWVVKEYGIAPQRLIVVSRGGTKLWYEGICGQYLEIFDCMEPAEFRRKNEQRIEMEGTQKHHVESALDEELFKWCKKSLHIKEVNWLHPRLMYQLFREFWRRCVSVSHVEKYTRYAQYSKPDARLPVTLPDHYVAMKFYFSNAFPETEENKDFVASLTRKLARKHPVLLLNSGIKVDDHSDAEGRGLENVIQLSEYMKPSDNLEIQTLAISGAKAFFGTYGGFSYLAPFYGVPSYGFYSREDQFLPVHLDIALRACRSIKFGSFDKIKVGRGAPDYYGKPDFSAMHVANFSALLDLVG